MDESRRRFRQTGVALGALGVLALRDDALERVEAAVGAFGGRWRV